MTAPVDFMMADLREKYEAVPSSRAFDRLYDDAEWGHMFAVLHKRLNEHFTDINGRAETTHHYWADNSRDLLSLIKEIEADLHTLRRAGVEVELAASYQDALERCRPWLSPSGGSTVPDDFEPIEIIKYEPVLTTRSPSNSASRKALVSAGGPACEGPVARLDGPIPVWQDLRKRVSGRWPPSASAVAAPERRTFLGAPVARVSPIAWCQSCGGSRRRGR